MSKMPKIQLNSALKRLKLFVGDWDMELSGAWASFLLNPQTKIHGLITFEWGEKHLHGATATTAITHIAIQEQRNGKTVDWMEKVSDEQYHT
jgi:hypothetical protein